MISMAIDKDLPSDESLLNPQPIADDSFKYSSENIEKVIEYCENANPKDVSKKLQKLSIQCSCRGLFKTSLLAADFSQGIKSRIDVENKLENEEEDDDDDEDDDYEWCSPYDILNDEVDNYDIFLQAKTYFDMREYKKIINLLEITEDPLLRFMRFYSQYLDEKEQDSMDIINLPEKKLDVENKKPDLSALKNELEELYEIKVLDAFELYLYGIVLKELKEENKAIGVFVASINKYPEFYDSWIALAILVTGRDLLLDLPEHWMRALFEAKLSREKQKHNECLEYYEHLHDYFPDCTELLCQRAVCLYDMRSFDEALEFFEAIRQQDPYRLDDIDKYSDILYVTGNKSYLSYLTHAVVEIDKFRPEVCCVIGNFYSLRGEHKKAVQYFHRALLLDHLYQSAWILMGHEYLELKNPGKAIDSYLKAVDINSKDYRAWYGLGQTYEILDMYFYALYYYRKTCSLRPRDGRMWSALANTYSLLKRFPEAIQCYNEASKDVEEETTAMCKLAQLYLTLEMKDDAARCFLKALNKTEELEESVEESFMVKACLFLAQYFLDQEHLVSAKNFAQRVFECNGKEKEDAKAILLQIRTKELLSLKKNA